MAFDDRAYAKRLRKAGVKRKQARAHAEAMKRSLPPDLATRSDVTALEQVATADRLDLEQRIDRRLTSLEQRFELPFQHAQMQALGVMAAVLGILFALRKLAENGRDRPPEQRRIADGR